MNIQSVKYSKHGEDAPVIAVIDGETWSVSQSEDNRHWKEILKWLAHTSSGSQPLTTNTNSANWDLIVDAATATTS